MELLRHILYEYKILMEAEGLTLSWHLEAKSHAACINTQQMVRVFQNLLDNARRYAARSAPVTVTAQDTGRLHICITNQLTDAHAIEPDRIFERFYCGDQARSSAQSSGLGLAIVKRIVELHGVRSMHRCRDRNCPFICFSDRRNLPCNRINLLHGSYSFSVYLAFVISFIILLLIPEDIYLSVLSPSCALLRKRLLPLSPFWQYIPPLYPYRPL